MYDLFVSATKIVDVGFVQCNKRRAQATAALCVDVGTSCPRNGIDPGRNRLQSDERVASSIPRAELQPY